MSEMLIKGIEMPKTGSRIIEINFRGEVFELFKTDNERGGFLKSRKLEAVELPPHGDLIDRSKLVLHGRVDDFGDLQEMNDYYDATEVMNAPAILEASK